MYLLEQRNQAEDIYLVNLKRKTIIYNGRIYTT